MKLAKKTSTAAMRIGSHNDAIETIYAPRNGVGGPLFRRRRGGRLRLLLRTTRHLVLRESRQRLVAHRQVIDGAGHHDRRLLHVVFDNPLVGVEVGVPGVRLVFDWILERADTREAG